MKKYPFVFLMLQLIALELGRSPSASAVTTPEKEFVFQSACERILVFGSKQLRLSAAREEEALEAGKKFTTYFKSLDEFVLERGYLVRLAELSLLSQEHILMFGPPGNAKSMFADLAYGNLKDSEGNSSYFKDQMTPETTLSDTHGYLDFHKMDQEGEVVRRYKDGVLGKRVGFLDEIFDIGRKALRNILGVLAERSHKDHKGLTWSLISATNHYISEVYATFGGGKDPQAVLDRYAFAAYVPADFQYAGSYRRLIRNVRNAFAEKPKMPELTFQEIEKLQSLTTEVSIPDHVGDFLSYLVYRMRPEIEAQEESSRRDHDEKVRSGESALPSWRSTKLMSLRTLGKAVNVLKSIIVLDWVESGGKRPLIANLDDVKQLEMFFSLNGPSDSFVGIELERSTDPHERSQLENILKERRFFREFYQEIAQEFNETITNYNPTEIAQGVQSFGSMTASEQKKFLDQIRELYFLAEAGRVTDELEEHQVTSQHIAHTALFESVHEWLVELKGEKEARELILQWEKGVTPEVSAKIQEKWGKVSQKESEKSENEPREESSDHSKGTLEVFQKLARSKGVNLSLAEPKSFESVTIPGGQTFMMGSPPNEEGSYDDEGKLQLVTITRSLEASRTKITQLQWVLVYGRNPSHFVGLEFADGDHMEIHGVRLNANHPVEQITFWSLLDFSNRLSELQGFQPVYDMRGLRFKSGTSAEAGTLDVESGELRIRAPQGDYFQAQGWRLPSEAEREFLARAGTQTPYPSGSGVQALDQDGWYEGNSRERTHAVARKKPNAWGISDPVGNVWDWTFDRWSEKRPGGKDPLVAAQVDSARALRGGGYGCEAGDCRSAMRDYADPDDRDVDLGGFLVRTRTP